MKTKSCKESNDGVLNQLRNKVSKGGKKRSRSYSTSLLLDHLLPRVHAQAG